ncbi:glycosyl hydrolase family 28 protein [Novosphingobium sp. BL-8H]|uniref:glycoside hydrolase family 28 protein n=1 Tax=Novosphingobium sp. BL-8H TaxID=3127640 RepID=UPI003756D04F
MSDAKPPRSGRISASSTTRRNVIAGLSSVPFLESAVHADDAGRAVALVTDFGARPDSITLCTASIQAAIDDLARRGGGTVVVPQGVFLSGALFLKPKVHLHLERGSVIRCTNEMEHFPKQRTRIEGHFEAHFTPALINADGCDGLRIDGEGTLDGSGRPVWDLFWSLRNRSPDPQNFPNIAIDRARLMLIENSAAVRISGITFKDSQFWNLHLYKCSNVTVAGVRFLVPDDYAWAPSTDGIDIDSCQHVLVEHCHFSVTDDCIAAKGSKGPRALEDRDSPPVEHILVRNCLFRRGHQAFSCGSEATIVRDVTIENCRVVGAMNVLMLKLRPDTPQLYEDIHVRDLTLDSDGGALLVVRPWSQYKDLQGAPQPQSTVSNVTLSQVKGRFGSFGEVRPNPGHTAITDIVLRDLDLVLAQEAELAVTDAAVRLERVQVNGRPVRSL